MDGRNPAPVDICGLSHYCRQVLEIQGVAGFFPVHMSAFQVAVLEEEHLRSGDFPCKYGICEVIVGK